MSSSKSAPRLAVAIMAAGKGTRLKSKHPKVLFEVGGRPLLGHVIAAASQVVAPGDIFAIIGHEAHRVREAVGSTGVNFVLQAEQKGTGHAVMCARQALKGYDHVLVLSGDAPLLTPETICLIRDFHLRHGGAMTLLSTDFADPTGYGRIIRRKKKSGKPTDEVAQIVEEKQLAASQKKITEINAGMYAFAARKLFANLDKLRTDNPHHEYYLTDIAEVLNTAGEKVMAYKTADAHEVAGANTRAEMAELDREMRERKCTELMAAGVTIFKPETCLIDTTVSVGTDTIIEPFVQLLGATRIGSDCRIRSYSVITDCELADGVTVRQGCVMEKSTVASGAVLGPYSHVRPQTEIGPECHVGNFVETKKTKMGRGSKANHLTYLGDAVIGENVNVGAGTITCNYDGVHKHTTTIEDGAFIGSDSTLVAPVKIGRGAYVGAAACITEDVPEDALAIARARQIVKEGWAKKKREEVAAKKGGR
jgi:bifunctional UDP-N-acetylglucosamine pyrophosphorylase/glucosamine-1-phosphate N-acetyltransferase